MKIAFVSDAIYPYNKGGKEKRLHELSTRLSRLGHDVHIYTMHWWDTPEKTRVEHGVTLHAISKRYDMYNGDRRSIKEGVLFGLACLRLFRVQADIFDVDHMPFFPIYSAWLVLKLRGRRLYGTWHEALSTDDWVSYMGRSGRIAAIIERLSIKLPYQITAASTQTKRLLAEHHGRGKRVSLVASGIDIQQIKRVKPAAGNCDVLYVGRLVKDKNVDKLVRAVALVAKQTPNVRCVIVGHGIEKPNLEKLIAKLGLHKQVSLLDPLPQSDDIYANMKAAKVFVLPSVREGFGIVALEALGCGTPVITVDAPANAAKDLIIEGQNGSVVALNPRALAQAIEQWISKPKPKNIQKQVTSYDWNTLATTQAEIYAA